MAGSEKLDRGRGNLDGIDPTAYDGLAGLEAMAPGLRDSLVEFAFGDIYLRPGLDLKTRELSIVCALAGMGGVQPQLTGHLVYALQLGWTAEELREALIQIVPIAGFPRAVNGLLALADAEAALASREA